MDSGEVDHAAPMVDILSWKWVRVESKLTTAAIFPES